MRVSVTVNSVFSSAAAAAPPAAGAAAATVAAAADTPNLSSRSLIRWDSSSTVMLEIASRISAFATAISFSPESVFSGRDAGYCAPAGHAGHFQTTVLCDDDRLCLRHLRGDFGDHRFLLVKIESQGLPPFLVKAARREDRRRPRRPCIQENPAWGSPSA